MYVHSNGNRYKRDRQSPSAHTSKRAIHVIQNLHICTRSRTTDLESENLRISLMQLSRAARAPPRMHRDFQYGSATTRTLITSDSTILCMGTFSA